MTVRRNFKDKANPAATIKTLSVKQPWASLIGHGAKTMEVRSRNWKYRGPLLITASLQPAWNKKDMAALEAEGLEMPRGVAIAVVDMVDCRPGNRDDEKGALVDPTGEFVWILENPRLIEPFPIKGQLSPFETPLEKVRIRETGKDAQARLLPGKPRPR